MESQTQSQTSAQVENQTVLIVDDNPANLQVMADVLSGQGFEVLIARDGQSGLDKASYGKPDLILLDVLMPGLDGFETCRRFKKSERTKDIPVIFMTSLAETERKIAAFEVGAVDYITKPFQVDEVLARVKTHLALRAMQTKLAAQNERLQQEITVRQQVEQELLEAQSELEHRVEARTAELAQTNASLVAEISERRRVEAEIERRNRELVLLNRVIAASAIETEADAILTIACYELAEAFEDTHSSAGLFEEGKNEVMVIAETPTRNGYSILGKTISMVDNPAVAHLLAHKTPLVAKDAQNDPRLISIREYLKQRGSVSVLIVPLVFRETVVGFLSLGTQKPHRFLDEEIQLAQSVASQVSGVLVRLSLDEERRRLETQYFQAQKMEALGQLTGGVAHDFNNMLTVIIGHSEILLSHFVPEQEFYYNTQQILKMAERAAALTRQLLAFSRQQVLQPSVINLNKIIADTENMLQHLIGEDIKLVTVPDPQLGHVRADAGQIEQIIMNLVVNARDAMPDGGRLTIETSNVILDRMYSRQYIGVTPGPHVMLAVSDTGVGMDAETQARIFEPFFTTKEQGKGTGLGLATIHGIVNQSSGHILVYSEKGRGTTFKIYLPQTESVPGKTEPEQSFDQSGQSWETILLVEDEDAVRQVVSLHLTHQGFTVVEAKDAAHALYISDQHQGPIHLLLTDVVMSGSMNGAQLARELTALRPEMKVLYMSGYTDNVIAHSGVLDPGIAFLQKPFAPHEIIKKVRQVLDSEKSAASTGVC